MKKVLVIGASMIDIIGHSFANIIEKDSNPGRVNLSAGGVSRNIAENLARLAVPVTFITALADDYLSQVIRASCAAVKINLDHTYEVKQGITTTYLGILDPSGDLTLALSDTTVLDQFPLSFLKNQKTLLDEHEIIVVDAALPKDSLEYLISLPGKKIYLDPVSVGKAVSVKDIIGKFHLLKCNTLEAEYLSSLTLKTEKDFYTVANYFHQQGIKQLIITRGPAGIFYSLANQQGFYRHRPVKVINATGAGDAFLAGYLYSELKGYDYIKSLYIASEVAALALESEFTVNPALTETYLKEALADEYQ